MSAPTLALPPPRFDLLCSQDDLTAAAYFPTSAWENYHHRLCRALAYETTLPPREKDHARWTELRRLAAFTEGVLKHRRAAA
jgi:hypothetical protein